MDCNNTKILSNDSSESSILTFESQYSCSCVKCNPWIMISNRKKPQPDKQIPDCNACNACNSCTKLQNVVISNKNKLLRRQIQRLQMQQKKQLNKKPPTDPTAPTAPTACNDSVTVKKFVKTNKSVSKYRSVTTNNRPEIQARFLIYLRNIVVEQFGYSIEVPNWFINDAVKGILNVCVDLSQDAIPCKRTCKGVKEIKLHCFGTLSAETQVTQCGKKKKERKAHDFKKLVPNDWKACCRNMQVHPEHSVCVKNSFYELIDLVLKGTNLTPKPLVPCMCISYHRNIQQSVIANLKTMFTEKLSQGNLTAGTSMGFFASLVPPHESISNKKNKIFLQLDAEGRHYIRIPGNKSRSDHGKGPNAQHKGYSFRECKTFNKEVFNQTREFRLTEAQILYTKINNLIGLCRTEQQQFSIMENAIIAISKASTGKQIQYLWDTLYSAYGRILVLIRMRSIIPPVKTCIQIPSNCPDDDSNDDSNDDSDDGLVFNDAEFNEFNEFDEFSESDEDVDELRQEFLKNGMNV